MYEYECLGCGKKFYSTAEYSQLKGYKKCDACGDYIFYSVDELIKHFNEEEWLKQEYEALEKIIHNDTDEKVIQNAV